MTISASFSLANAIYEKANSLTSSLNERRLSSLTLCLCWRFPFSASTADATVVHDTAKGREAGRERLMKTAALHLQKRKRKRNEWPGYPRKVEPAAQR